MPGQYFIYIPFNDAQFKAEADNWATIFENMLKIEHARNAGVGVITPAVKAAVAADARLRKRPIVCMHGDAGLGQIANLIGDDTVYVMAHCGMNEKTVSDNQNNTLDAAGLVARMKADGVPRMTRYIKLWACEGALGSDPFAASFFDAMKQAPSAFPVAELTAYTKSLKTFDHKAGHKRAIAGWKVRWGFPPAFEDIEDRASNYAVHYPPR